MALTSHLRIRCDPELKARLERIATAKKRSLSNWANLILERESKLELERLEPPPSGPGGTRKNRRGQKGQN